MQCQNAVTAYLSRGMKDTVIYYIKSARESFSYRLFCFIDVLLL